MMQDEDEEIILQYLSSIRLMCIADSGSWVGRNRFVTCIWCLQATVAKHCVLLQNCQYRNNQPHFLECKLANGYLVVRESLKFELSNKKNAPPVTTQESQPECFKNSIYFFDLQTAYIQFLIACIKRYTSNPSLAVYQAGIIMYKFLQPAASEYIFSSNTNGFCHTNKSHFKQFVKFTFPIFLRYYK